MDMVGFIVFIMINAGQQWMRDALLDLDIRMNVKKKKGRRKEEIKMWIHNHWMMTAEIKETQNTTNELMKPDRNIFSLVVYPFFPLYLMFSSFFWLRSDWEPSFLGHLSRDAYNMRLLLLLTMSHTNFVLLRFYFSFIIRPLHCIDVHWARLLFLLCLLLVICIYMCVTLNKNGRRVPIKWPRYIKAVL